MPFGAVFIFALWYSFYFIQFGKIFHFMCFGPIIILCASRNFMYLGTIFILCASAQFYALAIFVIGRLLPR